MSNIYLIIIVQSIPNMKVCSSQKPILHLLSRKEGKLNLKQIFFGEIFFYILTATDMMGCEPSQCKDWKIVVSNKNCQDERAFNTSNVGR